MVGVPPTSFLSATNRPVLREVASFLSVFPRCPLSCLLVVVLLQRSLFVVCVFVFSASFFFFFSSERELFRFLVDDFVIGSISPHDFHASFLFFFFHKPRTRRKKTNTTKDRRQERRQETDSKRHDDECKETAIRK